MRQVRSMQCVKFWHLDMELSRWLFLFLMVSPVSELFGHRKYGEVHVGEIACHFIQGKAI